MSESGKRAPRVELVEAGREQMPVLENLLELYIHEFSEFLAIELGADGRFGYPRLALYWSEPGRFPFLIHVDGRLAGFVLIAKIRDEPGGEAVWDVAEFFVARGFRRRGVGVRVAHQVWQRFAGRWQVRAMEANRPACSFWRQAVSEFLGAPAEPARVQSQGMPWLVFRFPSPRST